MKMDHWDRETVKINIVCWVLAIPGTLSQYVHNIFGKLGVTNRTQAALKFIDARRTS
jgi:hypothetical protein